MSPSRTSLVPPRTTGLSLVPALTRQTSQRDPLALWHLLSLDAPTVATLWTVFVARTAHVSLPWTSPASMFLVVWMLYAADRLLDARAASPASDLEARHLFHQEHRKAFTSGIIAACIALAALLPHLDAAAFRLYAVLGSLLFAYFFVIHIFPAGLSRDGAQPRLPKELAVGIFFPAAIFIPTVARAPALRFHLLPDAVLFAAVCTLNCLYLYAWEHPGAQHANSRGSAHWTTRLATRHLPALTTTTAVFAAAITLWQIHHHTLWPLALASVLSAALLLLLHTHRHRLAPIHLRAAADLTLLTPLLLLPFTL